MTLQLRLHAGMQPVLLYQAWIECMMVFILKDMHRTAHLQRALAGGEMSAAGIATQAHQNAGCQLPNFCRLGPLQNRQHRHSTCIHTLSQASAPAKSSLHGRADIAHPCTAYCAYHHHAMS